MLKAEPNRRRGSEQPSLVIKLEGVGLHESHLSARNSKLCVWQAWWLYLVCSATAYGLTSCSNRFAMASSVTSRS